MEGLTRGEIPCGRRDMGGDDQARVPPGAEPVAGAGLQATLTITPFATVLILAYANVRDLHQDDASNTIGHDDFPP